MKWKCVIVTEMNNEVEYQFEAANEAMAEASLKKLSLQWGVVMKKLARA